MKIDIKILIKLYFQILGRYFLLFSEIPFDIFGIIALEKDAGNIMHLKAISTVAPYIDTLVNPNIALTINLSPFIINGLNIFD